MKKIKVGINFLAKPDISVIIPAAGSSDRMKSGVQISVPVRLRKVNKPYLVWRGKPLLLHIIGKFTALPPVGEIIVAINPADRKRMNLIVRRVLQPRGGMGKIKVVAGGRARQDSVFKALKVVSPDSKIVLIHDAARPLIKTSEIIRVIQTARRTGAAILGIPAVDTIKRVTPAGQIIKETVLPRRELWQAQTPQVFKKEILLKAYRLAGKKKIRATDDAFLVEKMGYPVKIIKSRYPNFKITTPDDWQFIK
ncbi:MAG: 2-C-methyl-D-erythritol 4-phosphate cytidylyltransferase [Planctomycetota bacterium]